MVENHAGSNDLLDTTDCLEAVGVFKGWKNLLFLILVVCVLLLQAGFFLVDQGCITEGLASPEGLDVQPAEAVEPNAPDELPEPDPVPAVGEPEDANEPAELSSAKGSNRPQPQLAGWFPAEFFSKMTFPQLSWTMNLINAVLILTAVLYCLTLLFSLKVSMHGRLGGINHITRAFFLSLLMLVLLLPWQKVFGSMVTGAVFTPAELEESYLARTADAGDMLDTVLYYLRFSGYGVLMLLLLILSQIRSLRWAKAILRRLEII